MRIKVIGSSQKILYDFLKYALLYPNEMSNVMHYDKDVFKNHVKHLMKAYEAASAEGGI